MTKPCLEEDLRSYPDSNDDSATRRSQFEGKVAEIREHGIARVVGGMPSPLRPVPVHAFSAPIFNAAGDMMMALSLTTPATRLAPDWDGEVPRALLAAARDIASWIG